MEVAKSHLSVFDLDTKTSRILLSLPEHIEAPNWSPDGKFLLVNGGGRLFSLFLDEHPAKLRSVDTGFADRLNNDHGISPDGSMIVISDRSQTEGSCIYTLPIEGGEPTRVTDKVPSYWHGWSPDGKTLTYTAKRGETFQIYACPAGGGPETRITEGFDHCDGPDYSADGAWIWFNGERGGEVDLFRIHPDGNDLQQMTFDKRVNWFPHPSPDGESVVYLAYEAGTRGHPANRQVQLRIMPAEGGDAEVLCEFCGGQGTINVPSWAPDSRRFAYVRYEQTGAEE